MKISINCDLLEKIDLSKTGFSIKKTSKKCLAVAGIVESSAILIFLAALGYLPEGFLSGSMIGIVNSSFINVSTDVLLSNLVKQNSIKDLQTICTFLKYLDVNTNKELLLNSYQYGTEYDFIKSDFKIPRLEQKKYIMVPVHDNEQEKEVSLVQEHIIGTRTYFLSIGEPNKVLKLKPILT